jgi:hypothetical protein
VIAWPQNRLLNLADVRELQRAIDESPRPYLIHCAAGVNRSGAVGVLLAMSLGGQDFQAAKRQLESVYWGIRDSDSWARGRFAEYEEYCRQKGIETGGWAEFLKWLESGDPGAKSDAG